MPLARRLAIPLLAVGIALTAATPGILAAVTTPTATAPLAMPSRIPHVVPPRPRPRPPVQPPATPTTAPVAVTTASCADYDTAAAAKAALDADPQLAEYLDTDRDGRPCERTWPAPPAPIPEPAPAAPAGGSCSADLAGTRDHVARAGNHLADLFTIRLGLIGGRAARSLSTSDHPLGLALDFPVDRAAGDALADYVLDHRAELAVKYVIWRQRINHGSGWEPMADRGGITANHYDHVHVSFLAEPGPGLPC